MASWGLVLSLSLTLCSLESSREPVMTCGLCHGGPSPQRSQGGRSGAGGALQITQILCWPVWEWGEAREDTL